MTTTHHKNPPRFATRRTPSGHYEVCTARPDGEQVGDRFNNEPEAESFAKRLNESDEMVVAALLLPNDYLQSCKDSAAARNRKVYLFWSPSGLCWQSTIHLGLVPPSAESVTVWPDGHYRFFQPIIEGE